MQLLSLENAEIRLVLLPEFGGRVSELVDRRTGRNWLVAGPASGSPAADAVYGIAQATGWDECFPSVGACAPDDPFWPERLRDHGELWGRPAQVSLGADVAVTRHDTASYSFVRSITLAGPALRIDYRLTNLADAPMPWLWSQHMLLAAEDNDRLQLGGVSSLARAYLTHRGRELTPARVSFPQPAEPGLPDLSRIHPVTEAFAGKFFATGQDRFRARLGGPRGSLAMEWSGAELPWMGLWLDHGGWPPDAPARQLCIEPTTAPCDSLAAALATGTAERLPPGRVREWSVRLTLEAP